METINVGGQERVVAEGTEVSKEGGATYIEGFRENVLRRLSVAEGSIAKIGTREQALENEIQRLKAELSEERAARKDLEDKVKQLEEDLNEIQETSHKKK